VKKLITHKQRPLEVQLGLSKAYLNFFAKSKAVRVFGAFAFSALAKMLQKVTEKNYRSPAIDFQVAEISISFEKLAIGSHHCRCYFAKQKPPLREALLLLTKTQRDM
jgi:hypothetical protein